MVLIVGSGLSSIAAASALVGRGIRPTILDTGLMPDAGTQARKLRLSCVEPEQWNSEAVAELRTIGPTALNGIPRKLYFGSDFSFSQIENAALIELRQASMSRSFAVGGFSNVWGAVVQPLSQKELCDWPVTFDELAPHYLAVRRLLCDLADDAVPDMLGFAGATDGRSIRPSTQAQALFSDLSAGRADLARQGIRFEYASLAVRSNDRNGERGCRYCGLCLYGCPYDCRYSAKTTLERLVRDAKVRYLPGMMVQKLISENGHVSVEVQTLADSSIHRFSARHVLVGAGLLETSRIILVSLGLFEKPVIVNHSDIFTLPLLRYTADHSVFDERLHTLCQLVGQIEDARISEHPIHLQFYGYNDLYLSRLRDRFGPFGRWLSPPLKSLASRLFVIFGYLHSGDSSTIKLSLGGNRDPKLTIDGCRNEMSARISKTVARTLFLNRKYLRGVPIPFYTQLDLPGGGYHSGGSFPMSACPGALQTDRLGRLASLPGVHLVDASILPTIPAGTTAFSVMANAHRIGSELGVEGDV
jgi:choline dehydrogenase-like flavoprotein